MKKANLWSEFSQNEMFTDIVIKKDHFDCFWGSGREWFWWIYSNIMVEAINSERYCERSKSNSKQTSGKVEFQDFVFSWQRQIALKSSWIICCRLWILLQMTTTCFLHMKTWLPKQHFNNNTEPQAGMNECLKSQTAKFYDDGINRLVDCYDECLNLNREYVWMDKWFKIVALKCI